MANQLPVPNVHPVIERLMYITTVDTGGSLDLTGPEGVAQFRRCDPHGVVMLYGGKQLSIRKEDLITIARYFAAAGIILGMPLENH